MTACAACSKNQEDVFYYITLMNENYQHPAMPEGAEEGILKGMYLLRDGGKRKAPRVQLLGSGTILREVIAGADLLAQRLRRRRRRVERAELHRAAARGAGGRTLEHAASDQPQRAAMSRPVSADRPGPVIAASDYIKTFADQIRPCVPRRYRVLGTDGFGRSDYRARLRRFFEVDRYYVALAALKRLADEEQIPASRVAEAIKKYGIDPGEAQPGDGVDADHGNTGRSQAPGHRRFHRRRRHRGDGQAGRHGRASTTRSSRSNPTKPRWKCRRRSRRGQGNQGKARRQGFGRFADRRARSRRRAPAADGGDALDARPPRRGEPAAATARTANSSSETQPPQLDSCHPV